MSLRPLYKIFTLVLSQLRPPKRPAVPTFLKLTKASAVRALLKLSFHLSCWLPNATRQYIVAHFLGHTLPYLARRVETDPSSRFVVCRVWTKSLITSSELMDWDSLSVSGAFKPKTFFFTYSVGPGTSRGRPRLPVRTGILPFSSHFFY